MSKPPPIDPVESTTETMLGDLMRCAVDLAKALPEPWEKLPEQGQKSWLEIVEKQCVAMVENAITRLASRDWPQAKATVDTVTFKSGGAKASLKIAHASEGAHEIADCAGQQVLIIICDPKEFTEGGDKPTADPDQPSMPLDQET